jgi:hypothetical protein
MGMGAMSLGCVVGRQSDRHPQFNGEAMQALDPTEKHRHDGRETPARWA